MLGLSGGFGEMADRHVEPGVLARQREPGAVVEAESSGGLLEGVPAVLRRPAEPWPVGWGSVAGDELRVRGWVWPGLMGPVSFSV